MSTALTLADLTQAIAPNHFDNSQILVVPGSGQVYMPRRGAEDLDPGQARHRAWAMAQAAHIAELDLGLATDTPPFNPAQGGLTRVLCPVGAYVIGACVRGDRFEVELTPMAGPDLQFTSDDPAAAQALMGLLDAWDLDSCIGHHIEALYTRVVAAEITSVDKVATAAHTDPDQALAAAEYSHPKVVALRDLRRDPGVVIT